MWNIKPIFDRLKYTWFIIIDPHTQERKCCMELKGPGHYLLVLPVCTVREWKKWEDETKTWEWKKCTGSQWGEVELWRWLAPTHTHAHTVMLNVNKQHLKWEHRHHCQEPQTLHPSLVSTHFFHPKHTQNSAVVMSASINTSSLRAETRVFWFRIGPDHQPDVFDGIVGPLPHVLCPIFFIGLGEA